MTKNSKDKAAATTFWNAAEKYAKHLADNENQVEIAWLLRGVADAISNEPRDEYLSRDPNYGRYYRKGYSALMIH